MTPSGTYSTEGILRLLANIVEARKLEHHYLQALKVKYKGS